MLSREENEVLTRVDPALKLGIIDRSQEHLGAADKAIIQARRLFLQAIKTVQQGGDPPGVQPSYYRLRAIERAVPRQADWRALALPEMDPPDRCRVAEKATADAEC